MYVYSFLLHYMTPTEMPEAPTHTELKTAEITFVPKKDYNEQEIEEMIQKAVGKEGKVESVVCTSEGLAIARVIDLTLDAHVKCVNATRDMSAEQQFDTLEAA